MNKIKYLALKIKEFERRLSEFDDDMIVHVRISFILDIERYYEKRKKDIYNMNTNMDVYNFISERKNDILCNKMLNKLYIPMKVSEFKYLYYNTLHLPINRCMMFVTSKSYQHKKVRS